MNYKAVAVLAAVAAGTAAVVYLASVGNGRKACRSVVDEMLGEHPGLPVGFGPYRDAPKGRRPDFPEAV
ncbi:MAG: hypothetical protein HYT73_02590 [Candidatus Aenigmarchaeota archaeon]|nr:hypothetical protein [Candidatus Aenigmarchaeota archaeon]